MKKQKAKKLKSVTVKLPFKECEYIGRGLELLRLDYSSRIKGGDSNILTLKCLIKSYEEVETLINRLANQWQKEEAGLANVEIV